MKFLAILKDSLREAIDAKVFYVMIGLSVLVTLIALTVTFTPTPSGDRIMMAASAPLDLDEEDFALQRRDPEKFTRQAIGEMAEGKRRVMYVPVSVHPAEGAPDAPSSPFQVVIAATYLHSEDYEKAKTDPKDAIDHIRRRFGVLDKLSIVEATDVRPVDRPTDARDFSGNGLVGGPQTLYFETTTRPTAATPRFWWNRLSLFFGGLPLGGDESAIPLFLWIYILEKYIVAGVGAWVTLLTSVVLTSFFIPNMLRKGTVDMLIVKPIHRVTLLTYKYIGGLTFIFLNTVLAIGGVWVALGLRSGQWPAGFLVMIFVITFFFAILYSVSTLMGVLTRSAVVAIALACVTWFLLFLVGTGYEYFEMVRDRDEEFVRTQQKQAKETAGAPQPNPAAGPGGVQSYHPTERDRSYEGWFAKTVYAFHAVLPRTADINKLADQLLMQDLTFANLAGQKQQNDAPIAWAESISVSLAFIAVMLGIACWRFATKDY